MIIVLRNKSNKGSIDALQVDVAFIEIIDEFHEVLLDKVPAFLEELPIESIRPWCFINGHFLDKISNFLLSKWIVQMR
jgi:hypothetical protein